MGDQLYRILYCSRSTLQETAATEIRQILAKSRENNARDGITGGLFFSQQCFAQVLEGPAEMVENAFERIQCDERHGEITVLESGSIMSRDFPDWSMAFAGVADKSGFGSAIISAAFLEQTKAGDEVLKLLRSVVVREDEWLQSASV